MIKKLMLVLIMCFQSGFTNGGTIRPEISDQEYLDYGKKHECVVKLSGRLKNQEKEVIASGSGVVIDAHWILTAAHVVDCMDDPYFHIDDKKYLIDKVIQNPEFDASKSMSSGDLALCHVEEKIEIKFYPKLYDMDDENQKVCGISGYGLTGTALTGAHKTDDKRRAGSNKIILTTDYLLFCDMSRNNPTSLEFLIAHGDSGGGLFINGKLAGINSFVSSSDGKPDSGYGDESGHTRVSRYKYWIEYNMKSNTIIK